jgi:hypothetical protein
MPTQSARQGVAVCWCACVQILFVTFELIVTLMMMNLLIAMLTHTYKGIVRASKEWKRQVLGYS